MGITHTKRAEWLRDILAADQQVDPHQAAAAATDKYFATKKLHRDDAVEWDLAVTRLTEYAGKVAPGVVPLVYAVLKPSVKSSHHTLQQKRKEFSLAMRDSKFDIAAAALRHLNAADFAAQGKIAHESQTTFATLLNAVEARSRATLPIHFVDACIAMAEHMGTIEARAADHPSRRELPVLAGWLKDWVRDMQRFVGDDFAVARQDGADEMTRRVAATQHLAAAMQQLKVQAAPVGAPGIAKDALESSTADTNRDLLLALIEQHIDEPHNTHRQLVLSGALWTLLAGEAWPHLLVVHDRVMALAEEHVPTALHALHTWRPDRKNIALYAELLTHNEDVKQHPATQRALRFMSYLEGPAQYFYIADISLARIAEGNSREGGDNLVEHMKASINLSATGLLWLHVHDSELYFHGEHQRERISGFFGNLRDSYVRALTDAMAASVAKGSDAPIAELLDKARQFCGDGQLTVLQQALQENHQDELDVAIIGKDFSLDDKVSSHVGVFLNIQRRTFARRTDGYDADNLGAAEKARIDSDPTFNRDYINVSSFVSYVRTHQPELAKAMELGETPPSKLQMLLRRGRASKEARAAEFQKRLDYQLDDTMALVPDLIQP